MSDGKTKFEAFGSGLKDLVSALRDGVICFLFILLLVTPKTINDRLVAAGFKKGSIGPFEWEAQIKSATEETKAIAQTVEQADENYKIVIERLNELESRVDDPALRASVRSIGETAKTSRSELTAADRSLKRSLATQMNIVEKITPSAIATTGWILLGTVTEDKNAWDPRGPRTISTTPARISRGTRLTVQDDTYLRAESLPTARSSAPILDVVKIDEMVEVLEVEYFRARGGGWSVWGKVRRI